MIICSLEIENYKQYAGHHLIDFPEQGIVSVTGPNGAGKTTLFESIEWALYNPNTIPLATIPPHEGVGNTVVRVTLQDPVDGVRYVVQRELRRRSTQAEIYREDNPGEPIVQGTKDVTRFVTRHLIGLPHDAFVSTFFTRQKELHFFGDRSDTKRRTEVARLLGLEAVREAQTLIGEERTAARNEATMRRSEHDSLMGERDLLTEAAMAEAAVTAARMQEEVAETASLEAEQAAHAARQEVDRWQDLQLQASEMERQVTAVSGQIAALAAARDAATVELARLEERAAERMGHAAVASRLGELAAAVETHEAERERAQKVARLVEHQQGADARIESIVRRLVTIVEEHAGATSDPRWRWDAADAVAPTEALLRLHAVARETDPRSSRTRVAALQEVVRIGDQRDKLQKTADSFERLLEQLRADRVATLADGDPEQIAGHAQTVISAARDVEREARASIAALQAARTEAERVNKELHDHAGDAACPVCSRELAPGEAERLIAERDAEIARLRNAEQAEMQRVANAQQEIATGEKALLSAQKLQQELTKIDERIRNGEEKTEQARAELQDLSRALIAVEQAAHATYPIESDQLSSAQAAADQQERMGSLAGLLAQLERDLGEAHEARTLAREQVAALGEVRYDGTAHRQASDDLKAAQRAAHLIEQIDVDLARRPGYERQRHDAEAELSQLTTERARLQAEQSALGFDIVRLQEARAQEAAARAQEQQARAARTQARHAVVEAESALKHVRDAHAKLTALQELADRKTREADELHRMYTEFGEFDQYVARQVGPMLAESTERLLAQVTNSKYSQIRFDENYGIHVYDGDEDFPLSSFSGGERDVVALCARLALSEIVGSAATRPPRFLVLDEVFASLDVERREQLLETLGVLANGGHFRQMFIISHVEDVQQSPVMNEAWTITERDGSSQVDRPSFIGAPLAAD
jgi:exonuclease SbcC